MHLWRGWTWNCSSNRKGVKSVESERSEIAVVDCAPRDGLSAVPKAVSTEDKIRFIHKLSEAGPNKIDCISFTHPRLIPKNSDADLVMEKVEKKPGVTYVGLVPSEIGCRRAVVTSVDEITTLVAASEAFNKAALGLSIKETLNKTLPTIFEAASRGGKSIRTYILAAFGCPYSGEVPPEKVIELASRLSFMGAREISLLDSTGMANPKKVKELLGELIRLNLKAELAVHFHDTRGTALVNCLAAYEAGVRIFDTAVGGLSGTPFGAPELDTGFWNIPTEDLVHLFEDMGVNTGVDLDRLLGCVEFAEKLTGRKLSGHILKAGPAVRLSSKIPARLKLK
jgi:hydroxymethylglutaryl-CoA lyase